jgi:hypothetical protein
MPFSVIKYAYQAWQKRTFITTCNQFLVVFSSFGGPKFDKVHSMVEKQFCQMVYIFVYQFFLIFEGLGTKNSGIFNVHLVFLGLSVDFGGHLVNSPPFWYAIHTYIE